MPIRKAVIPVAGLGTRALPFTKEVPKEMLPILGTPTIHFVVEEAVAAGIEQVIFITGRGKGAIESYFDRSFPLEEFLTRRGKPEMAERIRRIGSMCEVVSVRQKEPLGLGHAVLCAERLVGDEPFAVCLGDEIFPDWEGAGSRLLRLIEAAEMTGESLVGAVEISCEEIQNHGVLDLGGEALLAAPLPVRRTVEKPKPEEAPSQYGIIGRYVFSPAIFAAIRRAGTGLGGEIQLTDGMDSLCRAGKLYALKLEGPRYDLGNPFHYIKAQIDMALRGPELGERLRHYLRTL